MSNSSDVANNYIFINNRVKELSNKYIQRMSVENKNNNVREAKLICVSKTKPITDLKSAFEAGADIFGENFVDEIVEKAPLLPQAKFHMIGHLQSNKINKLCSIPNLIMIQTIDKEELARKINERWPTEKEPLDVLIQVNTSQEQQKFGVLRGEPTDRLVRYIVEECPRLNFRGFMTIGESGEAKRDFQILVDERRRIASTLGVDENSLELSMGMSSDFEIAIDMGATFVRVGSSIFGPRLYKNER